VAKKREMHVDGLDRERVAKIKRELANIERWVARKRDIIYQDREPGG
jgi:hypothetical protein